MTATNGQSASAAALRAERRLLRFSTGSAAVFAAVAIVWGILADSQVILLDGMYALIGVLLGGLSLRVAALVERGPSQHYPFGREALAPLVVGVQGLVLLGSLGFAVFDAVQVILDGGGGTVLGAALAYAIASAVATLIIWRLLVAGAASSELVAAEAAQWFAGLLLSLGMFIGFGGAILLSGTQASDVVPYVDPVLVICAAAVIAPTPLRMLSQMYHELLEGAPPQDVAAPIQRTVQEVSDEFGLPEPTARIGKLGRKLYIEIDYLVADGQWSVSDADLVRRALTRRLAEPGRQLWINVELHTDPDWDQE